MGWEVDEVVPITCFIIKALGVTSTFAYCYAMLVDVDWVSVSMTDVRLLINGLLKVATLPHIWVDWGTWVLQWLPVFLWTATQAQRDHEIIHARNFRVQPHAIMGSSIVD